MASTSSGLVRWSPSTSGHSSLGLRMTYESVISTPIGSVEISARPVLPTTVSTSANDISRCSTSPAISTDSVSDTLGSRMIWTAMSPSSRRGTNSAPSPPKLATATAKSTAAPPTTTVRIPIARSRSGR